MIISIGCDHWGVVLKKYIIHNLRQAGMLINNYGPDTEEDHVDYVDEAFAVGEDISKNKADFGILICKTGIGMSIAANKVKAVRCAKVSTKEEAELCRLHNNANVLAISADITNEEALEIVRTFIHTKFSGEQRHIRRITKISEYEKGKYYEL